VEQFGLETFQRADNAVRANKASRQTADTFQASATFLDLLQIWGPIDPEIAAKIKYAKYHALRIAKAIKAGEDPNLSNPAPEPALEEDLPLLDPNDPDVKMFNGVVSKPRQPSVVEVPDDADRTQRELAQRSILDESIHPSRDTSIPRPPATRAQQPSVIEVPDEAHSIQTKLALQSSMDESLHPSRAPSVPRPIEPDVSPMAPHDSATFYSHNGNDPVSPIGPAEERKTSIGGNYFPEVPMQSTPPQTSQDRNDAFDLPSAPSEPSLPQPPTTYTKQPARLNTQQPANHQSPPPPPTRHHGHPLPSVYQAATPPKLAPPSAPRPPILQVTPQLHQQQPSLHQSLPPQLPPAPVPTQPVVVDEEAMMKAQKHARWAISALNFEDVPTAIRELKGALETLGAR
jgi:vacuolar protein sorting-associated protein VTA1